MKNNSVKHLEKYLKEPFERLLRQIHGLSFLNGIILSQQLVGGRIQFNFKIKMLTASFEWFQARISKILSWGNIPGIWVLETTGIWNTKKINFRCKTIDFICYCWQACGRGLVIINDSSSVHPLDTPKSTCTASVILAVLNIVSIISCNYSVTKSEADMKK